MKSSVQSHTKREEIYICTKDITIPYYGVNSVSFYKDQELWVTHCYESGNVRVCIGQGDWIDVPAGAWKKVTKITKTTTEISYEE